MTVTLNGVTYQNTDFTGLNYANIFPLPFFTNALAEIDTRAAAAFNTTSTSSIAVGTGSKAFVVADDSNYPVGAYYLIADDAAPSTNYMIGQVTSYVSGTSTLTISVSLSVGSGTKTAWTLSYTGKPGDTGVAGADGVGLDVDTASNHGSVDPTASNTLYFESDTGRSKIGDGSTAYSSLSYIDASSEANNFAVSGTHDPSTGTITVSLSDLDEIKDIRPTGDDTIDLTNVSASRSTVCRIRITNAGAHTLSWEVDGTAATSVTMFNSFTFTSSGEDDCLIEIDESQNVTIARWREDI